MAVTFFIPLRPTDEFKSKTNFIKNITKMKRAITITIALLIGSFSYAQDGLEQKLKALESNDTTSVEITETFEVEEEIEGLKVTEQTTSWSPAKSDTTTVRFGKRRIVIIEKDGSTSIEIPERNDTFTFDSDKDKDFTYKRKARFKGHWAGLEWGFNGFMDANRSINMKDDLKYLELRQGRSWNINLNILQQSFGLGTDKVGLVTGLGFEFNDYHFRNPLTLKVENGITMPDSSYLLNPDRNVTKTKLSMSHLTLPLLLEFQIPTSHDRHRVFISAGVIGGVRLGSHTKIEYEGANKGKDKVKNDYNLSSFRYGFTARVGYRSLKLFANYYPTPLFEEGKSQGPNVYPFSVGLILLSFN